MRSITITCHFQSVQSITIILRSVIDCNRSRLTITIAPCLVRSCINYILLKPIYFFLNNKKRLIVSAAVDEIRECQPAQAVVMLIVTELDLGGTRNAIINPRHSDWRSTRSRRKHAFPQFLFFSQQHGPVGHFHFDSKIYSNKRQIYLIVQHFWIHSPSSPSKATFCSKKHSLFQRHTKIFK